MIEAEVLILGAIATLFVLGWAVLGIVDAFRKDKPQPIPANRDANQPVQRPGGLTHQR